MDSAIRVLISRFPRRVVAVVSLLLAACILIPICTISLLVLIGPVVGDVFANIGSNIPPAP